MTDEELAAIRERLLVWNIAWQDDGEKLLAEVDRLRAENVAMREIVEAVARAGADPNYGSQTTLLLLCPGDDAETIRDKAHALLGKGEES